MAATSAKTRIACVRCATTFDAIFTDGQIQALSPLPAPVEKGLELAFNNDMSAVAPEVAAPVEAQPELQLDFASQPDGTHAPADGVSAYPADDVQSEETIETSIVETSTVETSWPESPLEDASEPAWQDFGMQSEEMSIGRETFSVIEPSLPSVVASKPAQPSDAYGMGVRLMRVSPMWLLLAGLSFISFIVLCNWLIKPDAKTGDVARNVVAADNHATNQSPARADASHSTAQSPVNSQPAQPTTDAAVSFVPVEATQAPATKAPTPGAETLEKPADVEKAAIPAASPNGVSEAKGGGEAKAGKVTIQIGSYNEASQAEERVANLKSAGYEAQSVSVEIPKRGTWYRVQSGRFVNRDEAERYGRQLRDKGVVSSFITTDVQE
jgi:cell division septation protein DedD